MSYLDFGATGAERHGGHDVSGVGGERAGRVSQLQPAVVDAGHGRFVKDNRHLTG